MTMPIKYAKHKSNNRVGWTIAIVWVISVTIGSPIVLGLNTSPQRTPELCIFYNSDFIIYSSLGSFYIPCLLMVFLYYRIFKAIHDRAKKSIGSGSSKPLPSSGTTGAGVKSQVGTGLGAGGSAAVAGVPSGPSTIPVKTGNAVKQGIATVKHQNSSADTAVVIENISLTARLKNNESPSFLEATTSTASSSNVETGKDDNERGGSNRLPLIRENTTTGTGNSDGQECEGDDDDGDEESEEDDDDYLPGCDSDIEAVECKVIKNKQAHSLIRECVVNVVQVDVKRSCPVAVHETELEIEDEEDMGGTRVALQRRATRNGNPDSGYAPSNAEESQFCVRNVHVLECEDSITSDKKKKRNKKKCTRGESPSLKLERESEGMSSSRLTTPLDDDHLGQEDEEEEEDEDETSAGIPDSKPAAPVQQLNAKKILTSGHESTIPITTNSSGSVAGAGGTGALPPSSISQVAGTTTQDNLTTNIKKKSRFKLGRKHKTSSKKKKREKASAKRERKATKTLAIVLGMNTNTDISSNIRIRSILCIIFHSFLPFILLSSLLHFSSFDPSLFPYFLIPREQNTE